MKNRVLYEEIRKGEKIEREERQEQKIQKKKKIQKIEKNSDQVLTSFTTVPSSPFSFKFSLKWEYSSHFNTIC